MGELFQRETRVVVTGATSGLGREMARQLGARGCRVALTGRRRNKLEPAAEETRQAGAVDVLPLHGTVTDLDAVRRHYERIHEAWGGLDVAILNAGVGDSRHARDFTADDYRWTFETNLFGVCNWMEVVLPDMRERGSGVIAGISSPAGWRGFPQTGSYSSSKAALSTMLESIRIDLRGTGVTIVNVCPGWVKSEITARNDPKDMYMVLETSDGAARILRGIERRRRVVHFPFPLTHLLRYVVRPMPGWLYDRVITKLVDRTKEPYVDESEARQRKNSKD